MSYYVGKTEVYEEIFHSKDKPTKEKYPEYLYVTGPYNSRDVKNHRFISSAVNVWRDSKGRVYRRELI